MNTEKLLKYIFVVTVTLLVASCGGKTKETTDAVTIIEEEEVPVEITESPKDMGRMSMVADSMALWADDLNVKEAVAVLTTFYRVHLDAKAKGNRRRDIQTMRKYLDVYDIVAGNHGNELKNMLRKVSEADTTLNLIGAVESFRELLSDYDSAHGQGSDYTESVVDTVSRDTVTKAPALKSIDASVPDVLETDPLFRPAD